jgi:hypothetical protein
MANAAPKIRRIVSPLRLLFSAPRRSDDSDNHDCENRQSDE